MKGEYKLFNTEEMIDKKTKQRMEGNRCKDCENKIKMKGGHYCNVNNHVKVYQITI